jgi:hypothetical protein
MKTLIRRWMLAHQLRAVKQELDYLFNVRRETVSRESQLRRRAEAINLELLRMELRRHA